jgi:hypothetical protein
MLRHCLALPANSLKSRRNEMWLRRNPWFEADMVPVLREGISRLL